jgi:hypothetical protein
MSKSPGGHMPGAASRLDAELMSKGLSANRTLTRRARPWQIKCRLLSAVPPTQQRRRDGKAA